MNNVHNIKTVCVVVCKNPKLLFNSLERKTAVLQYLLHEMKNRVNRMNALMDMVPVTVRQQ